MKKLFSGLLIIWGIVIVILGLFFGSKIPFEIHLKIYDEFKKVNEANIDNMDLQNWLGWLLAPQLSLLRISY